MEPENKILSKFGQTIPDIPVLFYIMSFFLPTAGLVIGALYMSSVDKQFKDFGKICFIISIIPVALILLFYIAYFVFIFIMLIVMMLTGAATGFE